MDAGVSDAHGAQITDALFAQSRRPDDIKVLAGTFARGEAPDLFQVDEAPLSRPIRVVLLEDVDDLEGRCAVALDVEELVMENDRLPVEAPVE